MKNLAAIKKCLILVIIHLSQNTFTSNKSVTDKKENETDSIEIKEFVGLKPKMYLFLEGNSEHKKAKGVNRNVVATISHDEYRDILLNNKCKDTQCTEHRIGSKEHRTGTYEINIIALI